MGAKIGKTGGMDKNWAVFKTKSHVGQKQIKPQFLVHRLFFSYFCSKYDRYIKKRRELMYLVVIQYFVVTFCN